jgi:hypothetical protein
MTKVIAMKNAKSKPNTGSDKPSLAPHKQEKQDRVIRGKHVDQTKIWQVQPAQHISAVGALPKMTASRPLTPNLNQSIPLKATPKERRRKPRPMIKKATQSVLTGNH